MQKTTAPKGLVRSLDLALAALLVAAAAVLIAERLAASGHVILTIWGDRDLWRALAVPDHWPLLGPEINGGLRSPGGAFYVLLAAILAFGRNVVAVNIASILLFAASVAAIGVFFARKISLLAGALTAASLAGSVTLGHTLGVWNPGFILIFATAATLFGYSFLVEGRAWQLGLATAAIAIGMQVHLQITQVALGLILAILVYRPRLTWRHAVALLLGLLLPYLPNLLGGTGQLVETVGSLPGDASTNYVFWEVGRLWPKAGLFVDLFGSAATEAGGRSAMIRLPLLAGDALAWLLAAAAVIATLVRPRPIFGDAPVGLFALILLVTAVTALFSDLLVRHMVAVTPAAAALVGLAGDRLIVRLRRYGAVGQASVVVICGLFGVRPLLTGLAASEPTPFQMESVAAQTEIAATLKPAFYADRESFEAHVAEFRLIEPHRWAVISNGIVNHLSFLYQTFPAKTDGASRSDCLAVISRTDLDGDPRDELAASPSLAGLGARFGTAVTASEHFRYFPYTTRDGNCLKTFPNGYIPTAFEQAYLAPGDRTAAHVSEESAVFAVPQPGHAYPIGVEVRREGDDYVAVLHGRLLRGYTGLYFRSIAATALCFVGDRDVRSISFGSITIGSPQRATLAPWRSPRFALADGRYGIWLVGNDARQPIAIREPVGELSVPDLQAAASSGASGETPPAACFNQAERIRGEDR